MYDIQYDQGTHLACCSHHCVLARCQKVTMQCQRLLFLSLAVVVCQTTGVEAFVEVRGSQGLQRLTSNNSNNNIRRPMPSLRQAAEDSTKDQVSTVNGDASGGGGLILQADAKSQLFASFSALSLSDQYDAVLTGLCAKILDSTDAKPEAAIVALEDPLSLLQEMNTKRIPASARSLMALVDVRRLFVCLVVCFHHGMERFFVQDRDEAMPVIYLDI